MKKSRNSIHNQLLVLILGIILIPMLGAIILINSPINESKLTKTTNLSNQLSEKEQNVLEKPKPMDFSETIVSNKKPFKANIINMVPEEELLITGRGKWNSRIRFIIDDPKNFDEIYSSGWNSAYDESTCTAADIDGDGIDEIILATQDNSEQMRLLVYDDAKHGYERISLVIYSSYSPYRRIKIDSGYINEDGYEDIAIVGDFNGKATCMIFLGQSSGVPHNVYTTWLRTTQHPSVVVADIDGDSIDEVVMLSALKSSDHTLYLNSYNYNPSSSSFNPILQKEYSCSGSFNNPSAAGGDFDNDGLDEIVVFGTNYDGEDSNGWVLDDALHKFASMKSWDNNDDAENPFVCTGNFDYDPADEFGLVYNKGSKLYIKVAGDANENFKQQFSKSLSNYPYPATAVSLNRDGDKCDELLISSMYKSDWRNHLIEIGWNSRTDKYYLCSNEKMSNNIFNPPFLAAGDFDGDGRIMQYQGWKSVIEPPEVLVVAAAAPNIDGMSHSLVHCGTTVGWEKTDESSTTSGFSITDSATITMSTEMDLLFFEVGLESSVSASWTSSHSTTNTVSMTFSQAMALSSNEHGVFYSYTYILQYQYKVISGKNAGTMVYINVPIEKVITCAELNAFISAYPEYAFLKSYIPYDARNPFTYYTKDEWINSHGVNTFASSVKSLPVQTQNSEGFTEIGIVISESTAQSDQWEFGFESATSVKVGSMSVEYSHERTDFTATEKISAKGMAITAAIGGLTGNSFDQYAFAAKMLLYEATIRLDEGDYTFKVVDYYITPLYTEKSTLVELVGNQIGLLSIVVILWRGSIGIPLKFIGGN